VSEATGADFGDYSSDGTTGSTSYQFTGLEDGEHYYVTVRAQNSGDSAFNARYPGEVDQVTDLPAPVVDETTALVVTSPLDVPIETTETVDAGTTLTEDGTYSIGGTVEVHGTVEVKP